MADSTENSADIKTTDIVFDCPLCGKSLAIDYHGAGLVIPCTDCGSSVQVPIPEGMEIADLDTSEEENEVLILNLRRSLSIAEVKARQLEQEIEELNARREMLEKNRSDNMFRFGAVLEKVGVISKALDEITQALRSISDAAKPRE